MKSKEGWDMKYLQRKVIGDNRSTTEERRAAPRRWRLRKRWPGRRWRCCRTWNNHFGLGIDPAPRSNRSRPRWTWCYYHRTPFFVIILMCNSDPMISVVRAHTHTRTRTHKFLDLLSWYFELSAEWITKYTVVTMNTTWLSPFCGTELNGGRSVWPTTGACWFSVCCWPGTHETGGQNDLTTDGECKKNLDLIHSVHVNSRKKEKNSLIERERGDQQLALLPDLITHTCVAFSSE